MGVVVDAGKERTSAAKAADEDKAVMAAVNRCATQNQVQHQLFPQPVKPRPFKAKLMSRQPLKGHLISEELWHR
jgi:hypothetical protein